MRDLFMHGKLFAHAFGGEIRVMGDEAQRARVAGAADALDMQVGDRGLAGRWTAPGAFAPQDQGHRHSRGDHYGQHRQHYRAPADHLGVAAPSALF